MNMRLLLCLTTWLIACAEKVEEKAVDVIPKQPSPRIIYVDPVDSVFATNFALLDSVLTKKHHGDWRLPNRIQKTMLFMDTTTGIPATGDGTPFGWFYDEITEEQYKKWKEWYAQNKADLKWDKTANKIVGIKE